MDLFGENYLRIRNNSIIPLVGYGIKRSKVEYWSFKDIITSDVISFNKISRASFEIEISKENFFKALHCDIELFINKTMVQYSDVLKSQSGSPCWSFVTLYYFSFFASATFFRFLRRGFIFLNSTQIKRLTDFSYAVNSDLISLDSGNYYFNYKEENPSGNVVLTLTSKGEGVHKLSWIQLESTFREFLPFCDAEEVPIYTAVLALFRSFKSEFPSTLRNKLNYSGDSSVFDLENRVPFINMNDTLDNLIKGLLALSLSPTDSNQIYGTAYISALLFKMIIRLHDDYTARSTFGKDFSSLRIEYLKQKGTVLPT
jgi:hypothetical protein